MSLSTAIQPIKRAASLSPEECREISESIKRDIKRSGKSIYQNGTDEPDKTALDSAQQKAVAKNMTLEEYRAWALQRRREKRKMKPKPARATRKTT